MVNESDKNIVLSIDDKDKDSKIAKCWHCGAVNSMFISDYDHNGQSRGYSIYSCILCARQVTVPLNHTANQKITNFNEAGVKRYDRKC
jgi:hypothetical protein